MKSAEDIKKYFQKSTLSTDSEKHEAVFEKILYAHEQASQQPEPNRINFREIVMRNSFSKITAAFLIIITVLIINLQPGSSGYLWAADLADKVGRIENVIFRSTSITIIPSNPEDKILKTENKNYYSLEHGYREEVYIDGNLDSIDIINTKENVFYNISHSNKQVSRLNVPPEKNEEIFTKEDPRILVKEIMSKEYKKIGTDTIDGIEVEGVECVNQDIYNTLKNANIKLWVDIKTELPVRIEYEGTHDSLSSQTKISKVMYDFQWNVDMDPALFVPEIPLDYKNIEMILTTQANDPNSFALTFDPATLDPNIIPQSTFPIDMNTPPVDQETMIKYLKDYAEFTNGFYPQKLQYSTMMMEMVIVSLLNYRDVIEEAREIKKTDPAGAQQVYEKYFTAIAKKAKAMERFYAQLVYEERIPAYYGDIVAPGEADKVLLRWKESDTEYRVIFGNLEAVTVDKDVMLELETTLPK